MRSDLGDLSEKASQEWLQRFAASADLFRRGFDLYTAIPPTARENVLNVWKTIAKNPDAFEFSKPENVKGKNYVEVAQDVIDKMNIGDRYKIVAFKPSVNDRLSRDDIALTVTDTKTGVERGATIEFDQNSKQIVMHMAALVHGSGAGKAVYQIGIAFANAIKGRIDPDGVLLGANVYRRTEQAFSGALRSGNANTVQPGVGQRIYGWNDKAKTGDLNLVRMALASARNTLEFVPNFKEFGYDLQSGSFYLKSKGDGPESRMMAESRVAKILEEKDVRIASISRSTLARAAITLDAIDGKTDVPSDIAKPVLYSAKERLDGYINERTKSLHLTSPQSVLDADIGIAVKAIGAALSHIREGDSTILPIPLGRIPHALTMLRVMPKMLRVDTSILKKVFIDKHSDDFGNITANALVRAIYQPAMILKGKDGEFEIVTSLITKTGPVIVPIAPDSRVHGSDVNSAAIKSIYGRKVSLGGDSILQRLKDGALLYADPELAQVAITGKVSVTPIGVNAREAQFSEARPIEVQGNNVTPNRDSVKPLNPYDSAKS